MTEYAYAQPYIEDEPFDAERFLKACGAKAVTVAPSKAGRNLDAGQIAIIHRLEAEGKGTKAIADITGFAISTIKRHAKNKKTNADKRVLTDAQAMGILSTQGKVTAKEWAKQLGCGAVTIYGIRQGRYYKHVYEAWQQIQSQKNNR